MRAQWSNGTKLQRNSNEPNGRTHSEKEEDISRIQKKEMKERKERGEKESECVSHNRRKENI